MWTLRHALHTLNHRTQPRQCNGIPLPLFRISCHIGRNHRLKRLFLSGERFPQTVQRKFARNSRSP